MLRVFVIVALVCAGMAAVAGQLLEGKSPLQGYDDRLAEWEVQLSPTKPMKFTGTVQQLYSHLEATEPEMIARLSTVDTTNEDRLEFDTELSVCHEDWGRVEADAIMNGIDKMKKLEGPAKLKAGIGCVMVACQGWSGLWWCNDGDDIIKDDWKDVADGASFLWSECVDKDNPGKLMGGQAFPIGHETGKEGWQVAMDSWEQGCPENFPPTV